MSGSAAMPSKEPRNEKLAPLELEILKILWLDLAKERTRPNERIGLTRPEILVELEKLGTVRSKSDIQNHLNDLKDFKPPLSPMIDEFKAPSDKRGDRQHVYVIDRFNVITWPSTAYMLGQLRLSMYQSIEQDIFVKAMLDEKLRSSAARGEIATESQIRKQLETAAKWGYIHYFNETVLTPDRRSEFESDYLAFVAEHLNDQPS